MTDRTIDPNTDMADRLDQPGFVDDGDIDTAPIMNAPRSVIDPELGDNVVDPGMVNRLERSADRAMHITIASSHSRRYFVCASPRRRNPGRASRSLKPGSARSGSLSGVFA